MIRRKGNDMPPRPQVTKEQLIEAALDIARVKGFEKVTAREVGRSLGMSSRPVFTYYSSMQELKADVYKAAYDLYVQYVKGGLSDKYPFRASGRRTIQFVKNEPGLFKLLCYPYDEDPDPSSTIGSFTFFEQNYELIKPTIVREYGLDGDDAKAFFRNVWLFTLGIAMLIISGSCPYTDDEIFKMMSEISLSSCKIYKDFPGLSTGRIDIGSAFAEVLGGKKSKPNKPSKDS